MALVRGISGDEIAALETGWTLALCAPDAATTPAEAEALTGWLPAPVPGTVAQALRAAGRWSLGQPGDLHDQDAWYRLRFAATGPQTLRLEGLATLAEVFLDGEPVLVSHSMFLCHEVDFTGTGRHALAIRFKALNPALASAKGPRPRWRPMMITPGSLRLIRTTPLGHMPGWSPPVATVGPWRAITCTTRRAPLRVAALSLLPRLDGQTGILDADIRFDRAVATPVELACAGAGIALDRIAPDRFAGRLVLDGIAPWWPHTHGEPALHAAAIRAGETTIDLGRVGFRRLELDRGGDGTGFGLIVNGQPVFCRGASWMPPDPVALGSGDPLPLLALARDAGMNMLRISGTTAPASQVFHDACDALGILVWQDLPFANFDYPAADPAFAGLVEAEACQLLDRLQASPSAAIVCGGSEIAQQAVMLGLTPAQTANPLFDDLFPRLTAEHAGQAIYLPHTPWGGPLPFAANQGVTHYFGVGAYCRPIEDVRRAQVRFASECLAFANVPSPARLRASTVRDPNDIDWKAGVPRDAGAGWDFEDTRDHYVGLLSGLDPAALRIDDPERYLALGRAAPAEVMEAVFAEWRRPGSSCAGGLVWFLNDLAPGAGWGVIDAAGEPKSTYFALKRAFRPVHVGLTDEGLNGFGIHLVNETTDTRDLTLVLACYGETPHPLVKTETALTLAPRSATSLSSDALIGRFFDITHAYRFGPPAHDATVARLVDPDGAVVAEAVHVLPGRAAAPRDIGLQAQVEMRDGGAALRVSTDRFARFVTIDDDHFEAGDQGFCLTPGESRLIPLTAKTAKPVPRGRIQALNGHSVAYGDVS
ncbi:glycosyl hydrolase 2 galactose-binding domain-containing protein [Phreatobacter stygius]|uniref:beta-mannosidase n=1 Tax=Phreatobacter stygius TaxID=1940610 RepID=A0A4D7B659_9HYPH|nr:glycoside hydrolase family 2 protein [Phreatobacter stygius]QCI63692.1 glycoside hydrolase family 2 protein [Phreatobacter stygius]